ncbi:hypothetical protein KC336_g22364, partial [Hortaea werneckii]
MDDLLAHLLVPQANGTLVPASSAASSEQTSFDRNGQEEILEQRPPLTTSAAPATPKRKSSGMSSPNATLDVVPSPSAQYAQDIAMLGSEAHAYAQDYSNLQSLEDFVSENPFAPKERKVSARAVQVNPEYSIKFNNLCVKHFIVPAFEYDMPHQQCETVSVQFGDREVDAIGPFASKKHAKEEVCKLAWPQLLEMDERLQNKRKSSEPAQSCSGSIDNQLLAAENFIGLLQEYTQANRQGAPAYEDSRTITTPIRFACTVRIEDKPDTPLGSSNDFYQSKQEAKRA